MTHQFIPILAQIEAEPHASPQALEIVVVGFLFVIVVLSLLAGVTAVLGACFARSAARSAERAQIAAEKAAARKDFPEAGPSAAAASGQAPEDDADDPRRVAVIAAAVHSVIGDRPHRVVSIRSTGPGWAQEGRRQIFSSHRVR